LKSRQAAGSSFWEVARGLRRRARRVRVMAGPAERLGDGVDVAAGREADVDAPGDLGAHRDLVHVEGVFGVVQAAALRD